MPHATTVQQRLLNRAYAAGQRWRSLTDRRAETVRRLRLGGPLAADAPARVQSFLARESAKSLAFARAGVTASFFGERRIGPTLDLDNTPPNEAARLAGVPVGRIVDVDASGNARDGFATGFLIFRSLMLTNHHVFATPDETRNCGIQFGYEYVEGGIAPGVVYALDPARFFYSDEALDFALVGVSSTSTVGGRSVQEFGGLQLNPTQGKILVGQAISIIQYPDGGPKKYGVRDNELLIAPTDSDAFIEYSTDTLPGSSGSPAFNKDWEVVALHHSGVPEIRDGQILTVRGTPWTRGMPDSDIHWIANEGVRVSRICAALAKAQVSSQFQPTLTELLATFHEDFSSLPAIRSQTEGDVMSTIVPQPAPTLQRGLSITVNGNAQFYFGAPPPGALPPAQPLPLPVPTVEKKLRFDPDYEHRPGYDPDFLDLPVPLPTITSSRMNEIVLSEDEAQPLVFKYHHYSLVMNRVRRLQMWSVVNVDYTASKRRKSRDEFGTDTWVPDPRIAGNLQIQDPELYQPAAKFDRGHIVRREDTAWGDTEEDEILANSDSFHWTNCTPQHQNFNRAEFGFHGLWGGLENRIKDQAQNVGNKMCIYAGPILDSANDIDHDFGAGVVKMPIRFWKIVCVTEDAGTNNERLRAYGFILDQTQAIEHFGIESFSPGAFKTFQVPVDDISKETGVVFDQAVLDADALAGTPFEGRRIRLMSANELRI